MSDTTTIIERDQKSGRFLSGCKPGPGRKVGSRNKLTESFVADLKACWERHGVDALERVARDQPEVLLKVIASLMPRDVRIDQHVMVEPSEFVDRFRQARALLGNVKVIDHAK
jgi:hypothetical protein